MRIEKILKLRGPNIWANFPVLEAWVDLEEFKDSPSNTLPGLSDRLMAWLPTMIEHRCGIGERGGFFLRLREGTYLGHILEHVTLELQSLAGHEVGFGRAREASREGVYKVAIEYLNENVAEVALEAAFSLIMAAIHDTPFDVSQAVERIRAASHEFCLGPSTSAIVAAATKRGIPSIRLNDGSLVQLGYGSCQRRINAAETDCTSALGEMIAQDKQLTRQLLQEAGIPVPAGCVVDNAREAWQAARDIGLPVVVKPQFGNHGRGVSVNLSERRQIVAAYRAARKECRSVVVEQYFAGADYRILVVGRKVVAAARREPAMVVGDGTSTIRDLVELENQNPLRSDAHATVLSLLPLDELTEEVLAGQGYSPSSIPAAGELAFIRRNANLSTGGTATDVTSQVHPEIVRCAVEAARIVGLDVAGVDLIAADITRPLSAGNGAILEVNAQPGLRMHLQPSHGEPQPVGEAIVEKLFPNGADGRIPVVAVTGVNGKTTTVRLISRILRTHGFEVGMACTDGIFCNDRQIDDGDCSGPQSARMLLRNPLVEAAVLETARGGILREGLGFDRCNVAVVTNIGCGDHLGLNDVETTEQLAKVKRTIVDVVDKNGAAVLNASDPLVTGMAAHCPGSTIYFSLDDKNPLILEWRRIGGKVTFARDESVYLVQGDQETMLVSLKDIPLTHNGLVEFNVENVLAAAAACWALGIPMETIAAGLKQFPTDAAGTPCRFNLLEINGASVVVDYGHNVSSLTSVLNTLDNFSNKHRIAVYSLPGDRRDQDLSQQGELLGDAFDDIVLYEDAYRRGRPPGQIMELIRKGILEGSRVKNITQIQGWRAAVEYALVSCRPGDLLLLQADSVDPTVAFLKEWGAPQSANGVMPGEVSTETVASLVNTPQQTEAATLTGSPLAVVQGES